MKLVCTSNRAVAEKAENMLNESGNLAVLDIDEADDSSIALKSAGAFSSSSMSMFLMQGHHSSKKTISVFSKSFANPGIVIFDAHPDCENENDIVPFLVQNNLVRHENILLVGTREWNKSEIEFLKSRKIKFYSMKEISNEGIHDVCDSVMSVAKDFGALYVSIDIDVVDPANAPGADCLSAGGMSSREILYFLQRMKLLKNLRAADLCEINLEKDVNGLTFALGAKIITEMC